MSASDAEMIMLCGTKYKTSILNFKLCAKTLCIHMAYKIGIYDSLKSDQCVIENGRYTPCIIVIITKPMVRLIRNDVPCVYLACFGLFRAESYFNFKLIKWL